MIKLLEYEGKAILAGCGIPVPAGGLHRALPPELDGPLVVKAQVQAGGRGKAGGIQFAASRQEALRLAAGLAGTVLDGHPVHDVYIEQRLTIEKEYYVAALVDRDSGMPVLLASAEGGVEIEAVSPDRIMRQPVDPLIGLQPFMVQRLARAMGLTGEQAATFAGVLSRLYETLVSQDAELVEINPLVLSAGRFIAADAKVMLDEDAAFRHPGRQAAPAGTAFELECRSLGVIGVEVGAPGGVAAIMNGAGLTMATLDEVIALGAPMSGVVELHGATAHGAERIAEVIATVLRRLDPAVLLINVHFQFRSLETIAQGIVLAIRRHPSLTPARLVLRLRGEKEAEALAILAGTGCSIIRDFGPACVQAVDQARLSRAR
jgi:succinyl-CoA synthetase beta subunit